MRHAAAVTLMLLVGCTRTDGIVAEGSDISRAAALDAVERALEEEGGEDADTAVLAALQAHGLGPDVAEQMRWDALRALLRREAAMSLDGALGRALQAWEQLAAADSWTAVARLCGVDPAAPLVHTVAGHVQAEDSLARVREALATAVAQHLDLDAGAARTRLQVLEGRALEAALKAGAVDQLAVRPDESARIAGRAQRRYLQHFVDEGFVDQAWPALADALGVPQPPPSQPAPPELEVLAAPLPCSLGTYGLWCAGKVAAGPLRVRVGADVVQVAAHAGERAEALLERLARALPSSTASCVLGGAPQLRIDQRAPPLDGTEFESVTVEPDGRLHGRLRVEGRRVEVLAGYVGCELRILATTRAAPGAPRDFDARVSFSSRRPKRPSELQVVSAERKLLASATAAF